MMHSSNSTILSPYSMLAQRSSPGSIEMKRWAKMS